MTRRTLLFLAVLSIAARAQTVPITVPSNRLIPLARLQQYLGLTATQVQSIQQNNDDYNRLVTQKVMRIATVQQEIAVETKKEPLDPGALGIRYAEIEAICRDLGGRVDDVRRRNLALLDQTQRTKLTSLEEVVKLLPTVQEAQSAGLLSAAQAGTPMPVLSGTGSIAYASFLLTSPSGTVPGCTQPASIGDLRTGDFTFLPLKARE